MGRPEKKLPIMQHRDKNEDIEKIIKDIKDEMREKV